jgi:aldehyde:ferredoxin oxidoreductase
MRNASVTTSNDNVAAKGGFGAVFGSKNLKGPSQSRPWSHISGGYYKVFELRTRMGTLHEA